MTKTGARVLLAVACVVAAAAAVQSFRFDRARQYEQARLLTIERDAGALLTSLSDLRAAQMAYLATGQGPDFWMRRVSELSAYVGDGISRLREAVTHPDAHASLDKAAAALTGLMQLDDRARSALQADQRFLASDLVFADGVSGTQALAEALHTARETERAAVEATLRRDSYIQLALLPVTALLVLIAAYVAGRQQRAPTLSATEEVAQMIRDLPPPVKAPVASPAATTTPATPPAPKPPAPPPPPPVPVTAFSWTETAELCVDLARVMDARDMPSLLQRAAGALEATGIIVWVVDIDGQRLTPALAHGYSDRVLAKLGTLDVAADNVTSLSYRSMRPQSMPGAGKDGAASAIAVPLVTTAGCNGVLAAEVPGAKPAAECVAVARILAAQLATMLSPLEPPAQKAAEA